MSNGYSSVTQTSIRRRLFFKYEQEVTKIFDINPPESDKQLIKEFKGITKDFVKAVIGAVQPQEPE